MKELVCVICGAKFQGKVAICCPSCRQKTKGIIKTCVECGKKERMLRNQKRCRACVDKLRKQHVPNPHVNPNATAMLAKMQKQRAEFNRKYLQDNTCPNYGSEGTNCLGCPEGAYEYKACGQIRQEKNK